MRRDRARQRTGTSAAAVFTVAKWGALLLPAAASGLYLFGWVVPAVLVMVVWAVLMWVDRSVKG